MAEASTPSYVYVAADLQRVGAFTDPVLAGTTERHHIILPVPPLQDGDPVAAVSAAGASGAVLELSSGLPSDRQLELLGAIRRAGRRAWVHWPSEEAIECVDDERLDSLRRHVRAVGWLNRIVAPIDNAITRWHRVPTALRWIYRGEFPVRRSDILIKLTHLTVRAQPLPIAALDGGGVYLRCDYWRSRPDRPMGLAAIDDQRMRDVVRALATVATPLACLTTTPNGLSGDAGLRQVVMDRPLRTGDEDSLVVAPLHYEPIVKAACQALQPSFIYERLTLGQYAGAEVSQRLAIPYIAEYPGAEMLRQEALGSAPPFYPELYAQVQELALRQASIVVVDSESARDALVSRGIDASRILVAVDGGSVAESIAAILRGCGRGSRAGNIDTGDVYKDRVQNQWNQNPVGSQHAREAQPHTLEWFLAVERHRYGTYAPWMPEVMEFARHRGEDVLEIGGGVGTDLAQFASNGARVTDVDLAAGHLQLAEENFRLRGLEGRFVHHDAETLPFPDASFDLVYSNGVLHHTPNTPAVIAEIRRVLRPGGRAIIMLYAENSFHYWRKQVWVFGMKDGLLDRVSMGEILSRTVECSANDAKPLVKVYTRARAAALFTAFEDVHIVQRQLERYELPPIFRPMHRAIERRFGWNLIVKATKR